jgi:hypothetical protein
MLGAMNPFDTNAVKDRIITTATDPSKLQTFAANTNQVVDPSKGVSPIVSQSSGQPDYMALIKKYAPYAIGAILLYYVISKK